MSDASPFRCKRRLGLILGLLSVAVAVVAGRVILSSRSAQAGAEQALAQGDLDEAIVRFRRAARWYAPGNPYATRALDALERIAVQAEARGDGRTARRAWEALRSALLSTRSFYTPQAQRLEPANRHIASLLSREAGPSTEEPTRMQHHLALLQKDEAPSVGYTLLALAGFALWIGGALLFIYRGIDEQEALRPRAALWSAIVVVGGFAAFLLGLARA